MSVEAEEFQWRRDEREEQETPVKVIESRKTSNRWRRWGREGTRLPRVHTHAASIGWRCQYRQGKREYNVGKNKIYWNVISRLKKEKSIAKHSYMVVGSPTQVINVSQWDLYQVAGKQFAAMINANLVKASHSPFLLSDLPIFSLSFLSPFAVDLSRITMYNIARYKYLQI